MKLRYTIVFSILLSLLAAYITKYHNDRLWQRACIQRNYGIIIHDHFYFYRAAQ